MASIHVKIILFFSICFVVSIKAQIISTKGIIIDAETSETLPYANIQLENLAIGTISGEDGQFSLKLPQKHMNKNLLISYIGYKTLTIPVVTLSGNNQVIKLHRSDILLGEVVIMPDSTLLNLLRKAYRRIPENYPFYPTKLYGFYKEIAQFDETRFLYLSEAVIETVKSSYKNRIDNGQVKIIKSLTNEFPDLKSFDYRAYSGVFQANEGDPVKKREDFIVPDNFKNFRYSLLNATTYQGYDVYVIKFETNNDSLKGNAEGKIYLEKKSLAYIAFEYKQTTRSISNFNKTHISSLKLQAATASVLYVKYKDKWHIKHIYEEDFFKYKDKQVKFSGNYLTTEITTDSVQPIPLNDRIGYGDFFSEKVKGFLSNDYWEAYNVLEKDSIIQSLYNTEQSKEKLSEKTAYKRKNSIYHVFQRFGARYGFSFLPIYGKGGHYKIDYLSENQHFEIDENLDPFKCVIDYQLQIDYALNNKWSLNFSPSGSLTKTLTAKSISLGSTYSILLNKWRNPLMLDISLMYSWNKYHQNFSKIENKQSFNIGHKTIDADILKLGIGSSTHNLLSSVGIKYNVRNKLWIYFSANYYLPVQKVEKLYITEKSGFILNRKRANINLTDQSLIYLYNHKPATMSNITFEQYRLNIGIIFNL